jgi:hypothetical protein
MAIVLVVVVVVIVVAGVIVVVIIIGSCLSGEVATVFLLVSCQTTRPAGHSVLFSALSYSVSSLSTIEASWLLMSCSPVAILSCRSVVLRSARKEVWGFFTFLSVENSCIFMLYINTKLTDY